MARYVLTPENTEINISYRGKIPLVIVKSSTFNDIKLYVNDVVDLSALNFKDTEILCPIIFYWWCRRYRNTIGGETYYRFVAKSGGDGSEIDTSKKGSFIIVTPHTDIDQQSASSSPPSTYANIYYQVDESDTILTNFSGGFPGRDDSGQDNVRYCSPTYIFIDTSGVYKYGTFPQGRTSNHYTDSVPDPRSLTTYKYKIPSNYEVEIRSDDKENNFIKKLYGAEETDPYNPYSGGGTAGPGGGGGSFSGNNDPIDIPNLPTISAVDAGFITIYKPTLDELRNLSRYMWSDLFSLDSFKKLFADPMDCILGLNIMPFGIASGGKANVFVGNMDTGISMTLAQQQYVAVDCGSVRAAEYSGSFFDYSPHTKYNIYLPYIGIEPLDPDEITGKDIRVVYHIDILTGSLICYIKVGNAVMYEYQGSCGQTIPINGSDFTRVFVGAVQIAGNVAGMVSTGGASAGAIAGGLLSSTSTAAGMKPNIEKSGSLSGSGGFLGNQKPFIIKETPRQCMPLSQQKYTGFPSYQTQRLGSLRGYTEVESVNLSGIPANDSELSEIESLLKGGVYL